jgi:uncharacterized protein
MIDRNPVIDGLRGLAIIIMFLAHSIPYANNIKLEKLFFIREVCSLAAPIFLFLVGYNFKFSNRSKFFLRVFVTLTLAIIIDIFVWKIIPFYSFDVLYLISFSLLILYFFKKFRLLYLVAIMTLVVLISVTYNLSGFYVLSFSEPNVFEFQKFQVFVLFKNLFFDGWFPIFPWIIFPIIGFSFKKTSFTLINSKILMTSIFVFIFTTIVIFYSKNYIREFSVEIFYPATFLYLILALSSIILFWNLVNFLGKKNKITILENLGKASLFFYCFHLLFYSISLSFFVTKFGVFLAISLNILFFILVSIILHHIKSLHFFPKKNKIILIIFGH